MLALEAASHAIGVRRDTKLAACQHFARCGWKCVPVAAREYANPLRSAPQLFDVLIDGPFGCAEAVAGARKLLRQTRVGVGSCGAHRQGHGFAPGAAPPGRTSVLRSARPSRPPSRAVSYVLRLPITTGTSKPP